MPVGNSNTKVKKAVVAIFAHPDDEAFGPSGTIHKLTKDYDVYLLCVTNGEAGKRSIKGERSLEEVRAEELLNSAKILGIKKVFFLGFADGTLSNNLYHRVAAKLEAHLKKLKPEIIITSELRGVSGHIDHIVVAMVTTYVFKKLKFIKKLMYRAITDKMRNKLGEDYFVYRPPGYKIEEMDEVIDVSDVADIKLAAMYAHGTQKHDYEAILRHYGGHPAKVEHFLVLTQ